MNGLGILKINDKYRDIVDYNPCRLKKYEKEYKKGNYVEYDNKKTILMEEKSSLKERGENVSPRALLLEFSIEQKEVIIFSLVAMFFVVQSFLSKTNPNSEIYLLQKSIVEKMIPLKDKSGMFMDCLNFLIAVVCFATPFNFALVWSRNSLYHTPLLYAAIYLLGNSIPNEIVSAMFFSISLGFIPIVLIDILSGNIIKFFYPFITVKSYAVFKKERDKMYSKEDIKLYDERYIEMVNDYIVNYVPIPDREQDTLHIYIPIKGKAGYFYRYEKECGFCSTKTPKDTKTFKKLYEKITVSKNRIKKMFFMYRIGEENFFCVLFVLVALIVAIYCGVTLNKLGF